MAKAKANTLIFKDAEKARDSITKEQQKEIAKLYEQWAEEIGKKAERFSKKTNPSAPLSKTYLEELKKQLEASRDETVKKVESTIKSNMQTVADSVVKSNADWLSKAGFSKSSVNAAFSYVPTDIVEKLVTGNLYEGGWSLSKAIWGDSEKTMSEAYKVVAGGLAKQQSIYEIAKDLEQFISPSAKKKWNLTDKDGRRIYPKAVDYSAQRLARTLTQHAYQQSFQETTKDNPFITKYRWNSNGSRVCKVCKERDGKIFDKDKLPLDHPNGMCTMEPVVMDEEEMLDELAAWVKGKDGDYPEIDKFAKKFGYTQGVKKNVSKATQKPSATSKPKSNKDTKAAEKKTSDVTTNAAEDGKLDLQSAIESKIKDMSLDDLSSALLDSKEYSFTQVFKLREDESAMLKVVAELSADENEAVNTFLKTRGIDVDSVLKELGTKTTGDLSGIAEGKDIVDTWKRRPGKFDFEIEDVMDEQGFNGLPKVVDAKEFDEAVKKSNFIAQRSYTGETKEIADEYRKMLYEGKWYVDCSAGGSVNGQGMYCAADWTGKLTEGIKEEMDLYSSLGQSRLGTRTLVEMSDDDVLKLLRESAEKIADKDDVDALFTMMKFEYGVGDVKFSDVMKIGDSASKYDYADELSAVKKKVDEFAHYESSAVSYVETMTLDPSAKVITLHDARKLFEETMANNLNVKFEDLGSFIAAKGYDAINAEGQGKSGSYTVILNRTKLIIKRPE